MQHNRDLSVNDYFYFTLHWTLVCIFFKKRQRLLQI